MKNDERQMVHVFVDNKDFVDGSAAMSTKVSGHYCEMLT